MRATREPEMAHNGLSPTEALDLKARQPPTSELVLALNAPLRAADPLPTPSPPPQSVNELMEGTLKEYEEECVEGKTPVAISNGCMVHCGVPERKRSRP